jgi:NADH-quinone oxidoreductase subunit G
LKRDRLSTKINTTKQKVEIATEENILLGRETDRKKISMVKSID